MKKFLPAILIGFAVSFFANDARGQFPTITTQFVNATQGEQLDSNIWINFSAGGAAVINPGNATVTYDPSVAIGTANIWNGSAFASTNIFTNSSYQLSTIQGGTVALSSFGGGRAYASYGAGLPNISGGLAPQMAPYAGWQPAPASPDPSFTARFQAFELTVQPTTTGSPGSYAFSSTNQVYADLSYIDQIGISTGINVLNAPAGATNTVQTSANTQALVNAVQIYQAGAASPTTTTAGSNVVTAAGAGTQYVQVAGTNSTPGYYSNYGSTSIANPAPNVSSTASWNVIRVAGPGQMPTDGTAANTATVYRPWDNYIAALTPGGSLNNGTLTTNLAGAYGTPGVPAQSYTASATFSGGNVTLGGTDYTGYIHISGFSYGGSSQTDIYIPYSSLTASTGLYGTNPSYSIGTTGLIVGPGNNLQTRVVGDIVAGMNFGLVGSTVSTTYNGTTQTLGAFTSQDWWNIGNATPNLLFGGAQSNPDFYNTYAAALQSLTTGYAFGIEDRLGQNTTEFNVTTGDGTNATLQFLIQPDIASVPEPGTIGLLAAAGGLLVLRRRKK